MELVDEFRRSAEEDGQDTARARIERSAVACPHAGLPAADGDDVVRGPARGFVDDEDAFHGRQA
jgi:hypothetical protein